MTVAFTSPQFVNQFKVLNLFIVPKHIWSKIADPTTDLNQHPVGTGPYSLTSWSAQAVTLDARSDYWGGQPKVKTMRFLPYNDNNSFTTALTTGQVQWGQGFIPNIDKIYASKDPAHNKYWFPGGLGIDQLSLNTQTAPFNDVAVRKAVNMVVDRAQISKVAESGIFPAHQHHGSAHAGRRAVRRTSVRRKEVGRRRRGGQEGPDGCRVHLQR